ncbi:MAG: hypothetical protein ACFE0Q_02145 [Anaerolineae bacterium]
MSNSKAVKVSNYHMQYSDLTSQHWHPNSERFAGGDNLITAMEREWRIEQCAVMTHWYAGMRSVRVYEFTLTRGDQRVVMPVLDNPYVERFVVDENIKVIEVEDNTV